MDLTRCEPLVEDSKVVLQSHNYRPFHIHWYSVVIFQEFNARNNEVVSM
jgi:hypothetical protein